jgi:DHA1 family multidrug resistance protein-like MFS transporter
LDKLNHRIFSTLFFSIFATVSGVGIVVPLLPVYAHQSGASGFAIGLIFGAFSISRTLFLPYFGRLSDRKGRKPLIVPGLFAYAVIAALFMASTGITSLIVVRFLQGIASAALMPVIQAYVGDITPSGREGATMGWFNLSMFFGLSVGPLAGGVIRDRWGLEAAFAGMGLLALVGFFLALTLLPPARSERIIRTPRPPAAWRNLVLEREMLSLFTFRFGYTFGIGILWSFLPILADGEHHLSGAAIGLVIMLGVLLSGIIQVPLGAVADRFNKRAMIFGGGLVVSLALAVMGWSRGQAGLAGASILFGIGGGISMAAHVALTVQKGSRTDAMGSVMAILTIAHSMGMMVGAVIAGLMMDVFNLRAVFPMGSAIMLGCTLAFFLGYGRTGQAPGRTKPDFIEESAPNQN